MGAAFYSRLEIWPKMTVIDFVDTKTHAAMTIWEQRPPVCSLTVLQFEPCSSKIKVLCQMSRNKSFLCSLDHSDIQGNKALWNAIQLIVKAKVGYTFIYFFTL